MMSNESNKCATAFVTLLIDYIMFFNPFEMAVCFF